MDIKFNNKVVLVTGASSGIGAGIAKLFSKCGALLSITGRNKEQLDVISKQCQQESPENLKPLSVQGDLSEETFCEKLVKETISQYKKIDIVIHSAGIIQTGTCETTTLEDYDKQMNINVRSVFYLTKLCIPHILETKGNFVVISSVCGLRSFPGVNSYCTSKGAIDHFTRCTALELASKGVRVNAVNPGVIKTEIHKRAGMDEEKYAKFLEHSKETHALGRHGEVEEVANAVLFLASDHASFITGVTLPIDGGRHAMCPR